MFTEMFLSITFCEENLSTKSFVILQALFSIFLFRSNSLLSRS